jgi:hypothetical protein
MKHVLVILIALILIGCAKTIELEETTWSDGKPAMIAYNYYTGPGPIYAAVGNHCKDKKYEVLNTLGNEKLGIHTIVFRCDR